jgi:hypothetical protein
MKRLRLFLLLLPVVLLQGGCAANSPDSEAAQSSVDANGEPVSAVPWNKPESWETTGQLGGMTGQ